MDVVPPARTFVVDLAVIERQPSDRGSRSVRQFPLVRCWTVPGSPQTHASDPIPLTSVKMLGLSQCGVHPSGRTSESIPLLVISHPCVAELNQIPRTPFITVVAGSSENQVPPFQCASTPPPT